MNDFDFLFGSWNVHNRRLHNPLTDSDDWYDFAAIALRLYDATTLRWSIYWSTLGSGSFLEPKVGTFANGVGTFFLVRFTWTHDGPASARWEQAFSADNGATWETHWIMNFARVSA